MVTWASSQTRAKYIPIYGFPREFCRGGGANFLEANVSILTKCSTYIHQIQGSICSPLLPSVLFVGGRLNPSSLWCLSIPKFSLTLLVQSKIVKNTLLTPFGLTTNRVLPSSSGVRTPMDQSLNGATMV